jgi:hypothetical protein
MSYPPPAPGGAQGTLEQAQLNADRHRFYFGEPHGLVSVDVLGRHGTDENLAKKLSERGKNALKERYGLRCMVCLGGVCGQLGFEGGEGEAGHCRSP